MYKVFIPGVGIKEVKEGDLVRVGIRRGDVVQVSEFKIPEYRAEEAGSLERAARRLLVEVYTRLTIFGGTSVQIEVEEPVFRRFEELFYKPQESGLPEGRGYASLGRFSKTVYGSSSFGFEHVVKLSSNCFCCHW
jgi:hypothetical protein